MSFDECIYPVLASGIDGSVNLIYQADYDVGTAVDGDHDFVENLVGSGYAGWGGLRR